MIPAPSSPTRYRQTTINLVHHKQQLLKLNDNKPVYTVHMEGLRPSFLCESSFFNIYLWPFSEVYCLICYRLQPGQVFIITSYIIYSFFCQKGHFFKMLNYLVHDLYFRWINKIWLKHNKPEDHWSCIAHLSAEDMLKSSVIEEKKFKRSQGQTTIRAKILMSTGRPHHHGHLLQV